MSDLVPRKEMVKQGMMGLGGLAGGIGLLVLRGISSGNGFSLAGLLIGGVVTLLGAVIGSSRQDRTAGLFTLGAGLATVAASLPIPWIGALAGALMLLGGIGLLGGGAFYLYKFWVNLRKRA